MQENTSGEEPYQKAKLATTGPESLRMLARDKDPRVRCAVARNSNTALPTLSFLAKDREEEVRLAVAGNPRAMSSTLALLTEDRSARVRLAAVASLSDRSPFNAGALSEGRSHGGGLPAGLDSPGTLLRYDSVLGSLVEVPVRLTEEVKRYVAENWRLRDALPLGRHPGSGTTAGLRRLFSLTEPLKRPTA